MNRRSRMKSTLDSLFSSSKTPAKEEEKAAPTPVPAKPQQDPAGKVAGKPTPEKKPSEKKPAEAAAPKKAPGKPAEKSPQSNPPRLAAPDDVAEVLSTAPVDKPNLPAPTEDELNPSSNHPADEVRASGSSPNAAPAAGTIPETPRPVEAVQPPEKAGDDPVSKAVEAVQEKGELADEEEHLVIFLLGDEAFGISIQMVESIIKKQAITKVPHVGKYILGVTNLRGTVVPVVDLRLRFSMPEQEATKDTRIIVLNTENGKNGIVVDEVMEVLRLPKSAIAPTPMIATNINTSYIKGIARTDDKLIILLDVNSILQQ